MLLFSRLQRISTIKLHKNDHRNRSVEKEIKKKNWEFREKIRILRAEHESLRQENIARTKDT